MKEIVEMDIKHRESVLKRLKAEVKDLEGYENKQQKEMVELVENDNY